MEFLDFLKKRIEVNPVVNSAVNESDAPVSGSPVSAQPVSTQPINVVSPDDKYFQILNPDTGLRFDIPLLSPVDPNYYFQYIYYMKLREQSPEAFQKTLNWE